MNIKQIKEMKRECIPSDLSLEELHELCDLAIKGIAANVAPEGYRYELIRLATDDEESPVGTYLAGESVVDAAPPTSAISISAEMIDFLHGKGPLDGVWFGEDHPKYRGRHWWRVLLP